jgi:predicted O-linked N-acetylglucosamine transferase (SPINDLY family)
MEALWQGVPVLTLKGDRWASRTSRTILTFGDLGEWVLDNPESLLDRAVTLVNDPASSGYLMSLRAGMRDRLSSSSVCDTREAARGFIDLLRRLVHRD